MNTQMADVPFAEIENDGWCSPPLADNFSVEDITVNAGLCFDFNGNTYAIPFTPPKIMSDQGECTDA